MKIRTVGAELFRAEDEQTEKAMLIVFVILRTRLKTSPYKM
jgi:hypothetical protein